MQVSFYRVAAFGACRMRRLPEKFPNDCPITSDLSSARTEMSGIWTALSPRQSLGQLSKRLCFAETHHRRGRVSGARVAGAKRLERLRQLV